ncbi:hypothetical protein SS50377_23284 [Spironucleus salmonicida]|uniref:Uncharacterized protein n=1 Tax=Spironucleus salmonicida TaxID=348837 RepID=V6LR65_9EUKA|nr:hypothetical protein SS50377_23284 [Spironucleus salmonicida]|eukprot:EST47152.1 Hypothetical protein SS50377_12663 [Spironucleus salmonicida]
MPSDELLKLRAKTLKLRQDTDQMEQNLQQHFTQLGLNKDIISIDENEVMAGMQAMAEKYKITQPQPRLPFSQIKPKPLSKPNSASSTPQRVPFTEKSEPTKSISKIIQKPPMKPVRPLSAKTQDNNMQGLSISGIQISGKK